MTAVRTRNPVQGTRRAGARARIAWGGLTALLAWAGSSWARWVLVEPADVAARCDAAPWVGITCTLRSIVVAAFVDQRLGVAAVGLALTAWWIGRRGRDAVRLAQIMGAVALAAGVAASVLYTAGLGVAAALLAAMVLADEGAGASTGTAVPAVSLPTGAR